MKTYKENKPKLWYPFGYNGKRYTGQQSEIVKCPICGHVFKSKVIESMDPDWPGFCHALTTQCPNKECLQNLWSRDGFEK